MKQLRRSAMALLAMGMVLIACDKDEEETDPETEPTPTARTVQLDVRPMVGDTEVALGTPVDINGQMVDFSIFQFYISELELMNDAAEVLADNDGEVILYNMAAPVTVVIGNTDEDHFHIMSMAIGLNADLNDNDPITAPAPLNIPAMHWGWNPAAGYKFARIEGTVDGEMFQYHTATNGLFRDSILVDAHSIMATGDTLSIALELDLEDLFEGQPMATGMNHGFTPFNVTLADKFGSGTPFSLLAE